MPNRITIGRAPNNTITVDESYDTVSNDHADIYDDEAGELFLTDHSSNGTKINGQRIQNTTVRLTVGDNIMLADVFPLDWNLLRQYFPSAKRPTVGYNNRGAYASEGGRRTVNRNMEEAQAGGTRGTERFDSPGAAMRTGAIDPGATSNPTGTAAEFASASKPTRISRPIPWMTIIAVAAAALVVMLILGVFVFDDVLKSLL